MHDPARILIVEDDSLSAAAIRAHLQAEGYHVLDVATRGEDAIARAHSQRPDLVLMDVVLEGEMDGVEAAMRIRSELGIPVVYLSAKGEADQVARAAAAEPLGYVVKPFTHEGLHAAVVTALYKAGKDRQVQRMLNGLPQEMIYVDAEERYRFVNRVFLQQHHRTAGEVVGKRMQEVLGASFYRVIRPHVRAALAGKAVSFEGRRRREDGSERDILISYAPDTDDAGVTHGFYGSITDVTDRKIAERLVAEESQRHRRIIDSCPDGFAVVGQDGRLRQVNAAFCAMLGYTPEEIAGMPLSDLEAQESPEQIDAHMAAVIERGFDRFETRHRRKDGTLIDLEVTAGYAAFGNAPFFYSFFRDIGARRQAHDALTRSRDFYVSLFKEFPTPVWRSDVSGACDYFNDTWLAFTGRTLEQEQGDGWLEGVHPDDRERVMADYLEAFQAQRPFELDYRLRHRDGDYHAIIDIGRPFSDAEGMFAGYIGACFDVEERRRYERALQSSQTMLQRVLDSIPVRVFWKDRDSVYLGCNRLFARDAGVQSPDEIVGKRDEDLSWKDLAERYKEDDRLVVGTGVSKLHYEEPQVWPDGTRLWLRTSKVPLVDPQDGIVGVLGVYEDITAQKRSHQALQESEHNLAKAQQLTHIGSWDLDLAVNRAIWSEEMYRIYGIGHDDFDGDPQTIVERYTYPQDLERVRATALAAAMGSPIGAIEYRLVRPDGAVRTVRAEGEVIRNDAGKPVRIIGTVQDITDRRRAFDELLARARQQAAVAELGRFALGTDDLGGLMRKAVEMVAHTLKVPRSKVLELRPDSGDLIVRAGYGWDEGVVGRTVVGAGQASQAGYTLLSGAPVIVDDTAKETRFNIARILREHEITSGVSVVIGGGDLPYGVLGAHCVEPRKFGSDDVNFLQAIANVLAEAVTRTRAEQELRRYAQRLATLNAIGRAMLGASSSRQILQAVLDHTREQVPCERVSITLFDFDTGEAEVVALISTYDTRLFEGARVSMADYEDVTSLDGASLRVIDDVDALPLLGGARATLRSEGIRSIINVPLRVGDLMIGTINFGSRRPHAFGRNEQELLKELGPQLAVAIQQALLYEQVQRHATDLEQRVTERTAELREINEELQSFAYSISHDLRAPLRAMEGFAYALREDYGALLDDVGKSYANRIINAAERMEALIRDLLDYSRISRAELVLETIEPALVVHEVLAQVQNHGNAVAAEIRVAEPLPPVVAHRATLYQILSNLVGNAVKFVAPDVRPQIAIGAERRNGRVRIWVQDNGIGVSGEHQERIFRIFERLHPIDRYPGTGIGLAIVRKGLERMGGTAGVESDGRHGSRFWIELPGAG